MKILWNAIATNRSNTSCLGILSTLLKYSNHIHKFHKLYAHAALYMPPKFASRTITYPIRLNVSLNVPHHVFILCRANLPGLTQTASLRRRFSRLNEVKLCVLCRKQTDTRWINEKRCWLHLSRHITLVASVVYSLI